MSVTCIQVFLPTKGLPLLPFPKWKCTMVEELTCDWAENGLQDRALVFWKAAFLRWRRNGQGGTSGDRDQMSSVLFNESQLTDMFGGGLVAHRQYLTFQVHCSVERLLI